jgi:hypothetical protein
MTEIGSLEAVFRKRAGEFGVAEKLERQEARVYELIDGKSGIPAIAALAQITRFDACKALAELKRKGRAETVSRVDSKTETRESRSRVIAQTGFWVLILVLAMLLANGVRIYLHSGIASGLEPAYDQSWQEERIRQALEIYRLEKGSYPGQLSDLAGQGLLGDWDLKFAQNSKYYYQEGGYNLTGPKP